MAAARSGRPDFCGAREVKAAIAVLALFAVLHMTNKISAGLAEQAVSGLFVQPVED